MRVDPRSIRPWLAVLLLVMLAMRTGDMFVWSRPPVYDAQTFPVLNAQDRQRVTSVAPKSFAAHQGIRTGDILHFPPRLDVRNTAQSLAPLRAFDERLRRDVTLTDDNRTRGPESILVGLGTWVLIAIALIVVLIRGERWSGIALALFLGLFGFTFAAGSGRFLGTWALISYATLQSKGAARRRLLIVAAATIIGEFSVTYAAFGAPGLYTGIFEYLAAISEIIMAIGLAYAIVVERLFDIGFVINRAVVFAVLSAAVVPLFIVVEWAAGKSCGAHRSRGEQHD